MARSWAELLGERDAAPELGEERAGRFARLRESLSKSRRALTEQIAVAAFDPGDELAWERLEEALIQTDVGVPATAELVRRLEARGELGELTSALAEEVAALLGEPPTLHVDGAPTVLLVAIFKARPSPFYVMDEVEAALDDTNLGRLITLFEELRETSQLIVITHQKRTMEIADALYGVSMRGDGITTVIGQRLREEQPA